VIVGAGATGVEMAGSLAEMGNTAMHVAYPELREPRVSSWTTATGSAPAR
jgi:NADH dehydrogenase FAD-containing subunit